VSLVAVALLLLLLLLLLQLQLLLMHRKGHADGGKSGRVKKSGGLNTN